LAYTARTYRLSQQGQLTIQEGQYTDRYSRAVEQLGNDNPEVRLGGIYALERLMTDSARDQPTIVEVLAAYVRHRATNSAPLPVNPTVDLQAALTVIGRRTPVPNERSVELRNAHLDGAILTGAHLDRANLMGAHLDGAILMGAHLDGAILAGAHLDRADLTKAHLQRAFLAGARLQGAILVGAHLEGAHLAVVEGLTRSQVNAAIVDDDTFLPAALRRSNPSDEGSDGHH